MKIRTKPILIICFIVGLAITLFVWVYEGTYHFKFTKPASPEVSAVQSIKGLIVAEFLYHEELRKGKFATLEEPAEHQLITTAMSSGTDNHYHFEIRLLNDKFEIIATPEKYSSETRMSFFATSDLVIRAADHQGGEARADDPIIIQ